MIRICLVSLVILLGTVDAPSQDIKGGEITVAMNGSPLQVDATVSLYVKGSLDANRPYIILHWGDATVDTLYSGVPQVLTLDTKLYIYYAPHTYQGFGTYVLSVSDSFRLTGICNVSQDPEEFYVASEISLYPSIGSNNSVFPVTYQVPCTVSSGYVHHNPGVIDPDGDSVSYTLVPSYTSQYDFPTAYIDPVTGDFSMPVWNQDSIYLIVIRIDEWKRDANGQSFLVGYVLRDMTIEVPLIIGLQEHATLWEIGVMPNPVSDVLTFKFDEGLQKEIVISDHLGREIYRKQTSENLISLSVQEFPEGMYFYSVIDEQGQSSIGKFIVAH